MRWLVILLAGCAPAYRTPPVEQCAAYCQRVRECSPHVRIDAPGVGCERSCRDAFSDPEVADVYGFGHDHVSCLVGANTCEEARTCE